MLKFKQYQYQTDACDAVIRCFTGQQKGQRKEIVSRTVKDRWLYGKEVVVDERFSNKRIELSDNQILQNVQELQNEQWITSSSHLEWYNFTVEMETGTWKTYVYTKTMFELNKHYGWSKFIVMVPSVAIREGVHKSLELTADHFQEIYGKKIRFFIYDTKNKSNLINIKNFANTSNIEVIIMNYQAFASKSKDSRKIFQQLDQVNSRKPIDLIKKARPILIIDEPQRFGKTAESMLKEFNPLFVTRYSATHRQDYNKIYRLDAIDAYNHKLVKKINVKWVEVVGTSGANSYLFLDRINISTNSYPTAHIKMEIEMKQWTGIKKVLKQLGEGDDLYQVSNELQQYKWYVVKSVDARHDLVSFTNWVEIHTGQVLGDIDEAHVRRIQIRETIESHLEKERLMFHKWIKVLSLFFIDEVAKYREYDEHGNQIKGEYEKIFEEEYRLATNERELFDDEYNSYLAKFAVEEIHKGYFSIDKKGRFIDSKEKRGEGGSDDVSAYDLIMKQKERLLDFNEPTRFIFSHSALREGWDNPNVFQLCTLKHSQSTISKRQEIGRWLRICVNKHWERMDHETLEENFFDINTLTVIASDSYDTFAKELQKEILDSLSDRPVIVTVEVLKNRILKNKDWEKFSFDDTSAMNLIIDMRSKWYINEQYKITDSLVQAIDKDEFSVPSPLKEFKNEVAEIMMKIHNTDTFKMTTDDRADNVSQAVLKPNQNFAKKEFQDLWNKIKTKTVYEVDFDSKELIEKSIQAIDKHLHIKKVIVKITKGSQEEKLTSESLSSWESMHKSSVQIEEAENIIWEISYDLIGEITKWANITRKTVVAILKWIREDKFRQFSMNPEDFIRQVCNFINQEKATTLINKITYRKTDQSYTDDVFTINNFKGSLKENVLEVKKHIYDYVKTDSQIERQFAKDLETWEVSVYAKLPWGFKIPTPVGNYNPDRAIVFNKEDIKHIYFIAETKGSLDSMQLKEIEKTKIKYAKKHFESLGHTNIKYDVVKTYSDLFDMIILA